MEKEIIEREAEEFNDKNEYEERPQGNSEEMNDLVDLMSMEE